MPPSIEPIEFPVFTREFNGRGYFGPLAPNFSRAALACGTVLRGTAYFRQQTLADFLVHIREG